MIVRGPLRGRRGWIAGNLEDRASRGITKAVVHAGAVFELLEIRNLQADHQLSLFAEDEQDQPHRPAHPDRHGCPGGVRNRLEMARLKHKQKRRRR